MTKGEKIRKLREGKGISQTDLANRVGITKQTLYKYEVGIISNIPSDTLELIIEALGTTPDYIFGWKKRENVEIPTYDSSIHKLIKYFPQLTDSQKSIVLETVRLFAEQNNH